MCWHSTHLEGPTLLAPTAALCKVSAAPNPGVHLDFRRDEGRCNVKKRLGTLQVAVGHSVHTSYG